MNHFKGAVSLSGAIEITYEGMSKDEQAKLDLAVCSLFPTQNKAMTPTSRTDLILEAIPGGQSCDPQQVVDELRPLIEQLERELTNRTESLAFQTQLNREVIEREKQTHDELAAERELADKLAIAIEQVLPAFGAGGDLSKAWDAWNKERK